MIAIPIKVAPMSPLSAEMQTPEAADMPTTLADSELAVAHGGAQIGVESGGTLATPDGRVIQVDRVYRK